MSGWGALGLLAQPALPLSDELFAEPGTEQTMVLVLSSTLVGSPKPHTFKLEQQRELMCMQCQ